MACQVRVLTINKGEKNDTTLYRLEKGWCLRFAVGPTLQDQTVRVFCTQPQAPNVAFNNMKYYEITWTKLGTSAHDTYDDYAELKITMAGSFSYFFTIDGSDFAENANGSGYFLVDPGLVHGPEDEPLPLDCIQCQSVISKLLGPLPDWEKTLLVTKETGYNMIHFTPLQELGYSKSAYSLKEQHKLNSSFNSDSKVYDFNDLEVLVKKMAKEWGVLSMTDLVLNHTANNSDWVHEHPECTYNIVNSPHLRPAYVFDRILWHFSAEIAEGKWTSHGIPPEINCEDHLNAIHHVLLDKVIPRFRLHEYYLLHLDEVEEKFKQLITAGRPPSEPVEVTQPLEIQIDPEYRRLKCTIDFDLAVKIFNTVGPDWESEEARVTRCCVAFRECLDHLNGGRYDKLTVHMHAAVKNVVANARYRFLACHGPRLGTVTKEEPIMWKYFLHPVDEDSTVEEEEELMSDPAIGSHRMAHNGWVMDDDPLRNFAEPGSNIYLRRELIVWGDSVKLRFGQKPEDCPFLWEYMKEYATTTARIFHGVRLDNCHSTPLHVAEFMLSAAREVRPDLYVIAELFTKSEDTDNIFINRLGINSLIREAMSAGDSHEEGRLVFRYGGRPVGSFIKPPVRPLMKSLAHALFFDQTHDNQSPVEVRSVYDLFPSAAIVSMASCATGSNRGYDELVPNHIHVVSEKRCYKTWTEQTNPENVGVNIRSGIIAGKKALNRLHYEMGMTGFTQVYVDQVDTNIVAVTRHNPVSHMSVICVARTSFGHPHNMETGFVPPLCVPGTVNEIILEGSLKQKAQNEFIKDLKYINGLTDYVLSIRENVKVYESEMVELRDTDTDIEELEFVNFPPGSVLVIRVSLNSQSKNAILALRSCLTQFGYRMRSYSGRKLERCDSTNFKGILSHLSLNDFNRMLYRCDGEERDDGKGYGMYNIPNYGDLKYCGLQGFMTVMGKISSDDDLGHPMSDNLRNGDWMCDYISSRLTKHPTTKELGRWFESTFAHLKEIPRYMIPCYFEAVMEGALAIAEETALGMMSEFVRTGSSFVRALAIASLQFVSVVKTAALPRLSTNLATPLPNMIVNTDNGKREQACVTISAGLPHFSQGVMRCWGRDTFISMRGILLLEGRYQEARYIILAFGACLRHGLIPNLLGAGSHARFNCRDAVWWWLHSIQDYCCMVPDGANILKDWVSRIYPTDESSAQPAGFCDQPLHDVMQEALNQHYQGLQYRERFAGHAIDRDMSHQGFNSEIGVSEETGFVFGGNEHNCGTWMDKMGSSEKAGNKGKPATPRDGSAVELVGLCKSAVTWLDGLHKQGHYPYKGVEKTVDGETVKMTFGEWSEKIKQNFEKHFWINICTDPDEPRPDLINRRGIYKDSVRATQVWSDYQLRCNAPITMVVAPEIFTPENAWAALENTQKYLLGPLGMKTLDPKDWAYRGDYNNSDDSHNFNTAKGFNYHQGPEWLWPVGYFLRAKLIFAKKLESSRPGILCDTVKFVRGYLSRHHQYILESEWRSLPELTNSDGKACFDSCAAQAWSVGCILEVLYALQQI
ncbi:glycogen debranching enzyme-like isoform X2 [Lineus longissimus]|uniref:glycogen debranching enzyme-like isoform X2 n=1 Tax=Lineus longissimus TaxID=88925 RepID=UPI002B4CF2B7